MGEWWYTQGGTGVVHRRKGVYPAWYPGYIPRRVLYPAWYPGYIPRRVLHPPWYPGYIGRRYYTHHGTRVA